MRANDERSSEFLRHGAYLCLHLSPGGRPIGAADAVPALAERLGLRNEFEPGEGRRRAMPLPSYVESRRRRVT